ncbi:MAG: hypothetical protein JOY71_04115 [Acetobacteraceae bacterium]|nr:hypothetical protein [Acetobacteraceae bacterium]MBV8521308.1 hypothetical protein [Acetobacteraceae bacterium]MBV8589868.1 hypothetical protein [Acetobacteraceae bacterium]
MREQNGLFANTFSLMQSDVVGMTDRLAMLLQQLSPVEHFRGQLQAALNALWDMLRSLAQRAAKEPAHDYTPQQNSVLDSINMLSRLADESILNSPDVAAALRTVDEQTGILAKAAKDMPKTTEVVKTVNQGISAANALAKAVKKA